MQDKVTIKIPMELYHKQCQLIEGTGFSSVTEFIVFVMQSLASGSKINVNDKLPAEEMSIARERLRILSYLKEKECTGKNTPKRLYPYLTTSIIR